jgi:predicted O-methyltransferase YrrM
MITALRAKELKLKKEIQSMERQAHPPQRELSAKHLVHAQLLPDRYHMLSYFPKHAVVLELGVNDGDFSGHIMRRITPHRLHLVDTWSTERYRENKSTVLHTFREHIHTGQVVVHTGYSTSVASHFPDSYFDVIYIDTSHDYDTTKTELTSYLPKMKPGGIIAGHDFTQGNWDTGLRYGVREAVREFCVIHDWEFIFLTMESNDYPSFAIRKITIEK